MLLEYISDGLRVDRIRENVIDKFGGLNSSIKLASSDLLNNCLFVARSKLGGMASRMVFLVRVQLLPILPTVDFPKPVLDWI